MPGKGKGKVKKAIKKVVNTIRDEIKSSRNRPINVARRTNSSRNQNLYADLQVARENKKGRRTTARLTRKINKQKSKY